jgi:hypothetical protein
MAEEDIKAFQIRLPLSIYRNLSRSADENLRSLNAEITVILRKFFENRRIFGDLPDLPPDVIRFIEKSAVENRRSVNDEVIVLLEAALAAGGAPVSGAGLERYLAIRDGTVKSIIRPEPDPGDPAPETR